MWHPNSKKHKAKHRGYNSKPTSGQINALMGLYAGCAEDAPKVIPVKQQPGAQLKLEL